MYEYAHRATHTQTQTHAHAYAPTHAPAHPQVNPDIAHGQELTEGEELCVLPPVCNVECKHGLDCSPLQV